MNQILLTVLFTALLIEVSRADTAETKGTQIAKKAESRNAGYRGEESQLEMLLIDGSREVRRKMNSKKMETEAGEKTVFTFRSPPDVRNTRMLTWTHDDAEDDQWLYLPSLKRVKRISSSGRSGSFMGSELSYEDLGSQDIKKYRYRFLKDTKVHGRDVWVLERTPKNESTYSKQIVWMDKEYYCPLKIEYFDKKQKLLKTAHFSGHKKIKKWWRPAQVEVVNHQTAKKSILVWSKRNLNLAFDSYEFESSNLSQN